MIGLPRGVKRQGVPCSRPPPPLGSAGPTLPRNPGMLINALFFLLDAALGLLWWAVLLAAIVQTLLAFNVLDGRNRIVWTIADFLYRVTEPLLRPIRNRLPSLGGVDLSPLVLLLLITAVQRFIVPGVYMQLKQIGL